MCLFLLMYRCFIKRIFDIFSAFFGVVLLAVPMLIVAVIIKLDSAGPVLFKQRRIGIHKKTFTILKFRSMPTTVDKDLPTHQFNGEKQLSRWQRFMRKASIDELPQLFNILAGSMSVVGPRPALWNQEDLIAERDKYGANDVKPGLTGLAQISGRDELPIALKAKLDGDYAAALKKGGFFMDVKCFFGTITAVFSSKGVVEGGTGAIEREADKVGK